MNDGKSKELFDLWAGGEDLAFGPLSDAVMPDAKTKGIEWKYAKGSFGPEEGGTYQHWEDGGYRTHDATGLKFTLYVDGQGIAVKSYDDGE